MKCTLRDVMSLATRARINGVDWVVVTGPTVVVLRRASVDPDPRVCYVEMKFNAAQEVQLNGGCVTAVRADSKMAERVTMWLFREVAITAGDLIKTA